MLLVSEDIPGITMPAAPKDLAPLEEEEPDFDLDSFRQEEDIEEAESGNEGPLRVFLGSDNEVTPVAAIEDESPVFDVSALAMPAGPSDDYDDQALQFLDDDEDFEDSDVVDLDGAAPPPTLSMGVSSAVSLDDASAWEDTPTQPGPSQPATPSTAVIRDTPPPIPTMTSSISGDPADLPDPFDIDADVEEAPSSPEQVAGPTGDANPLWDEDDTGFFDIEGSKPAGLPAEPPKLNVDSEGESRTFRAIPDKEDPPILPLLVLLIGCVIAAVFLVIGSAGDQDPPAAPEQRPNPAAVAPAIQPAPRTEGPGQVSEVAQNIGFITVHSDKAANVYVDDRKVGITPVIKAEVMPGAHRVLAVEVETGKRKAVTADVERGAERRVRFAFQPVQ